MSLLSSIPKYLLGKTQMISTLLFTVLFSLISLLLMVPLSMNNWFNLGIRTSMIFTLGYWIIALLFLCISRHLLHKLRFKNITYIVWLIWHFTEIIVLSLLYTAVTVLGSSKGYLPADNGGFWNIFGLAICFCIFGVGVPTALAAQYFAICDKDNTIRLMNFSTIVSDEKPSPSKDNKIMLHDNNGALKLVINLESLYFIESDDNYIKVWYQDSNAEIIQYMLRCRLKTVEESFSGSDLVRCHRKYIVNMRKVDVLSHSKDGYVIDLGLDSVGEIPISKTYEAKVLEHFNSINR